MVSEKRRNIPLVRLREIGKGKGHFPNSPEY